MPRRTNPIDILMNLRKIILPNIPEDLVKNVFQAEERVQFNDDRKEVIPFIKKLIYVNIANNMLYKRLSFDLFQAFFICGSICLIKDPGWYLICLLGSFKGLSNIIFFIILYIFQLVGILPIILICVHLIEGHTWLENIHERKSLMLNSFFYYY